MIWTASALGMVLCVLCMVAFANDRKGVPSKPSPHDVQVLNRKVVPDYPSASAMEALEDNLWLVVGDDATRAIAVDGAGKIAHSWPLDAQGTQNGRVAKFEKRDFEAIAAYDSPEGRAFIILGSGSRLPQRAYVVIGHWKDGQIQMKEYHAPSFYAWLRVAADIPEGLLNIEGATVLGERLVLANRENNCVMAMHLDSALAAIMADDAPMSLSVQTWQLRLESMGGKEAGLSGLSTGADGRIYYSASVEARNNAVADGAVLGSFVGAFGLNGAGMDGFECRAIGDAYGRRLPIKLESIVPAGNRRMYGVTDNDAGGSEWIEIEYPATADSISTTQQD